MIVAIAVAMAVPALEQSGAADDMEAQPSLIKLLIKKHIKKGYKG
jgi:hypothetical protein